MPILSLEDIAIYAPGVSVSSDAYLTGLIARTQAFAESSAGANRKLEATEYTEYYDLHIGYSVADFYLRHSPVLTTPEPVFQNRIGSQWVNLSDPQVVIDGEGRVEISSIYSAGSFTIPFDVYFPNVRLRAIYTSGFDFSASTNDVLTIKAIAGNLAQVIFQADGGANALNSSTADDQFVEEYSIQGGERIRKSPQSAQYTAIGMAAGDKYNKMISQLLLPLKKYAPRAEIVT